MRIWCYSLLISLPAVLSASSCSSEDAFTHLFIGWSHTHPIQVSNFNAGDFAAMLVQAGHESAKARWTACVGSVAEHCCSDLSKESKLFLGAQRNLLWKCLFVVRSCVDKLKGSLNKVRSPARRDNFKTISDYKLKRLKPKTNLIRMRQVNQVSALVMHWLCCRNHLSSGSRLAWSDEPLIQVIENPRREYLIKNHGWRWISE